MGPEVDVEHVVVNMIAFSVVGSRMDRLTQRSRYQSTWKSRLNVDFAKAGIRYENRAQRVVVLRLGDRNP